MFDLLKEMSRELLGPFIIWMSGMFALIKDYHSENKLIRTIELGRTKKLLEKVARLLGSFRVGRALEQKLSAGPLKLEVKNKQYALTLIALAVAGLLWQIGLTYSNRKMTEKLWKELSDTQGHFYNEASGGAAVEGYAYLVDDESAAVYKLELINPGDKSELEKMGFDRAAYDQGQVRYAFSDYLLLGVEGTRLSELDIRDPDKLVVRLRDGQEPHVAHLRAKLSDPTERDLEEDGKKRDPKEKKPEKGERGRRRQPGASRSDDECEGFGLDRPPAELRSAVIRELDGLIAGERIFDAAHLDAIGPRPLTRSLFEETEKLLGQQQKPDDRTRARLNRLLLEDLFPGLIEEIPDEADENYFRELDEEDVDDFEAVAHYDGKLYIITSHSNTKQGKHKPARERLLEVSLPGPRKDKEKRKAGDEKVKALVTNSAVNLRDAIYDAIKGLGGRPYWNPDDCCELMQIEGLAIKPQKNAAGAVKPRAFIGLRAPVSSLNAAFVLEAWLEDLFASDNPDFEVFHVDLQQADPQQPRGGPRIYGITSLDWDERTGKMLITGGAPDNIKEYPSVLCDWVGFNERREGSLQHAKCDLLTRLNPNWDINKLELLLLPPRVDLVFTYQDTDNSTAGRPLAYERSRLGLK